MIDNYCASLGKQFILMSPVTAGDDYDVAPTGKYFTLGEVDRIIYDLSQETGWDFISSYKASVLVWLWDESALFYSRDKIHPNGSVYGIIANNIIAAIEQSRRDF